MKKKSLQTVQEEPASVNATASDAAIAPKRTMQATLEQSFQPPKKKYKSDSEEATSRTQAIARFIVKDMRPYSIVEGDAFKDLIKTFDARYVVPNRHQFSDVTVPCMYETTKNTVKEKLKQAIQVFFYFLLL